MDWVEIRYWRRKEGRTMCLMRCEKRTVVFKKEFYTTKSLNSRRYFLKYYSKKLNTKLSDIVLNKINKVPVVLQNLNFVSNICV